MKVVGSKGDGRSGEAVVMGGEVEKKDFLGIVMVSVVLAMASERRKGRWRGVRSMQEEDVQEEVC